MTFNFAEFTSIARSFMETSCVVDDMIEIVQKVYSVPNNDLLTSVSEHADRSLLGELLRRRSGLDVIASM
jgi:hypothetical protein